MKLSVILLSALLVIPSLVACGGDDDEDGGGANVRAICEKGCATGATLDCANEPADCVGNCEADAAEGKEMFPNCGAQIDALGSCYADLPSSSWVCNDEGESEPADSTCQAQQDAILDCAF